MRGAYLLIWEGGAYLWIWEGHTYGYIQVCIHRIQPIAEFTSGKTVLVFSSMKDSVQERVIAHIIQDLWSCDVYRPTPDC